MPVLTTSLFQGAAPDESVQAVERAVTLTFEEVYSRQFDFVWRMSRHHGIPEAAARDVAQEVFVVVHAKLRDFKGGSIQAWLAAITRRVASDYRRKRGNRPTADEPLEEEPASTKGPNEVLESRAAARTLQCILQSMTELQREAFVLYEVEGLSAVEIAKALNSNPSTIRTRLRSARQVFRTELARHHAQQKGEVEWSR